MNINNNVIILTELNELSKFTILYIQLIVYIIVNDSPRDEDDFFLCDSGNVYVNKIIEFCQKYCNLKYSTSPVLLKLWVA